MKPIALVTGASSGIGAAFARRLAGEGYDLIVVARRRDRLEALAAALDSARVEIVQADLGTDEGVRSVSERASASPLSMLVNNAGLANFMPFTELSPAQAEELIRVNVLAPTLIARAAVQGMVARRSGAIVNVASLLAFSGPARNPVLPKRVSYAATKSYVVTFAQVLASELAGTGVRVQALCPGIVRTEFHTRQGLPRPERPQLDPDEVVTASLRGLENDEVICAPTLEDTGAVDRMNEASSRVLAAGENGVLARRYSP